MNEDDQIPLEAYLPPIESSLESKIKLVKFTFIFFVFVIPFIVGAGIFFRIFFITNHAPYVIDTSGQTNSQNLTSSTDSTNYSESYPTPTITNQPRSNNSVVYLNKIIPSPNQGNQIESPNERDAKRKHDLTLIANALNAYYKTTGHYPIHCDSDTVTSAKNINPWIPELTTKFIPLLPVDPLNHYGGSKENTFQYQYESKKLPQIGNHTWILCDTTGQSFVLSAHLENQTDPQINWDFYDSFWGGWYANYVVTSGT